MIGCGGANGVDDVSNLIKKVNVPHWIGSMVVYQKKNMGVLVNFPFPRKVEDIILKINLNLHILI